MAAFGHHPTGCECKGCNPDPEITHLLVRIADLEAQVADRDSVIEDKRRLTKALDVACFGKDAAEQASLCDLMKVIPDRIAELKSRHTEDQRMILKFGGKLESANLALERVRVEIDALDREFNRVGWQDEDAGVDEATTRIKAAIKGEKS